MKRKEKKSSKKERKKEKKKSAPKGSPALLLFSSDLPSSSLISAGWWRFWGAEQAHRSWEWLCEQRGPVHPPEGRLGCWLRQRTQQALKELCILRKGWTGVKSLSHFSLHIWMDLIRNKDWIIHFHHRRRRSMKDFWETFKAELDTQSKLFTQMASELDEQVAKQFAQLRDEQTKQRKNVRACSLSPFDFRLERLKLDCWLGK